MPKKTSENSIARWKFENDGNIFVSCWGSIYCLFSPPVQEIEKCVLMTLNSQWRLEHDKQVTSLAF